MELKIITGALLLVTIITGFWLHHLGRPLNSLIFTIHKLTALAAAILTLVIIFKFFGTVGIILIVLILAVLVVLSLFALFISGAFSSIEKFEKDIHALLIIHNIATISAIITIAITFYIMSNWK